MQGADSKTLTLKIDNEHTFAATIDLSFHWRVVLNGAPLSLPGKEGAGWRKLAVATIPAQVRTWCTRFSPPALRTAPRAPLAHPHAPHCPQDSATVPLGVPAADIAAAASAELAKTASIRSPELFLEARAAVDRATPWCDKVSLGGRGAAVESRCDDRVSRCGAFENAGLMDPHLPPPHQGHLLADAQLELALPGVKGAPPVAPALTGGTLDVSETAAGVVVTGADSLRVEVRERESCARPLPRLVYNACRPIHTHLAPLSQVAADSGSVAAWSVRGHDLLREPILPLFYRAPTDNDRGGSGGNSHANR